MADGSVKVKDDASGNVYTIPYVNGKPPTSDQIGDFIDRQAHAAKTIITPQAPPAQFTMPPLSGSGPMAGTSLPAASQSPLASLGITLNGSPSVNAPAPSMTPLTSLPPVPPVRNVKLTKQTKTYQDKTPYQYSLSQLPPQIAAMMPASPPVVAPSSADITIPDYGVMDNIAANVADNVRLAGLPKMGVQPQNMGAALQYEADQDTRKRALAQAQARTMGGEAGPAAAMLATAGFVGGFLPGGGLVKNAVKAVAPLVIGGAAATGTKLLQDEALKRILGPQGYEEYQARQAKDAQDFPADTFVASQVPYALAMKPGPLKGSFVPRLQSAAMLGGLDAAHQGAGNIEARMDGQTPAPLDVKSLLQSAAVGAFFNGKTPLGEAIEGAGVRAGAGLHEAIPQASAGVRALINDARKPTTQPPVVDNAAQIQAAQEGVSEFPTPPAPGISPVQKTPPIPKPVNVTPSPVDPIGDKIAQYQKAVLAREAAQTPQEMVDPATGTDWSHTIRQLQTELKAVAPDRLRAADMHMARTGTPGEAQGIQANAKQAQTVDVSPNSGNVADSTPQRAGTPRSDETGLHDAGPATSGLQRAGNGGGSVEPAANEAVPERPAPGLPYHEKVDGDKIGVLPGIQYKRGTNDNAVTDLFKNETDFKQEHAGLATLYKDLDGNYFAADAHHRVDLLNRAKTVTNALPDGSRVDVPRQLNAQILDAKDGWTPESARKFGILNNLRENKGVAIDAADALLGKGTQTEIDAARKQVAGLPSSQLSRAVQGLTLLGEQGRSMVRNGTLKQDVGAAIGEVLRGDAQRQAVAIEQATGNRSLTSYDDGAALARKVLEEPLVTRQDDQGSMFDDDPSVTKPKWQSTAGKQAELERDVVRQMRTAKSKLLDPTNADLRQGEHIDVEWRKAEAAKVGEASSKSDALFKFDPDVKTTLRQVAADVLDNKISHNEGIRRVREVVEARGTRNINEILAGKSVPVTEATGGAGLFNNMPPEAETKTAPAAVEPNPDALTPDEAAKMTDGRGMGDDAQSLARDAAESGAMTKTNAADLLDMAQAHQKAFPDTADDHEALGATFQYGDKQSLHDFAGQDLAKNHPNYDDVQEARKWVSAMDAPRNDKTGNDASNTVTAGTTVGFMGGPREGAVLGKVVAITGERAVVQVVSTEKRSSKYKAGDKVSVSVENLQLQNEVNSAPKQEMQGDVFNSPIQTLEARPGSTIKPSARIQPASIPWDGKPLKSNRNVILDMSKGFAQRVEVAKQTRGAAGSYWPGNARLSIRFAGDLDTTAHELGHSLDDQYNLVGKWATPRTRSPFDGELIPNFSKYGSGTTTGPRSALGYRRAEGVAEWIRAYIINPDAARAAAPKFAAHFETTIPTDVRAKMDAFGQDIRRFAGAPGDEQLSSNVRMEGEQQNLRAKLKRALGADGYGEYFVSPLDKLQTSLQDSLKPFAKAIDYARRVQGLDGKMDILPENDPLLLTRLHGGITAKVSEMLESGLTDAKGNKVTEGGLHWLIEPLDSTSKKMLEADMKSTVTLMVAQRTLEKGPQLNTERVSGIGAGIYTDSSVAKAAIERLKSDPEKYKRLTEAASRYRDWANHLLDYSVEKGRLSQADADKIKADNQQYVAMHRIGEDLDGEAFVFRGLGGPKRLASVKNNIQKFTGSTKEIDNPYRSLVDQTFKMVGEADRNAALKAFRDILVSTRGMYEGDVKNLAAVGTPAQQGDERVMRVFVDGKEEKWQLHPEVYQAVKAFGASDSPTRVEKALRFASAGLVRKAVTHDPGFLIRNVIRDAVERPFKSQVGSTPFDIARPLKAGDVRAFRLAGGDGAGNYVESRPGYNAAMKDAVRRVAKDGKTILTLPRDLAEGYNKLAEGSELVGRMAEYRKAYDHARSKLGYDEYNSQLWAASEARGLMDFAVAGTFGRQISHYIPFTNASIQGNAALLKSAKRNPGLFAARFSILAASCAMNYLFNKAQGKDTLNEYRDLPAYQRDLFWNFKAGPDLWVRVPKGFELAVLASGVERAIDRMDGNVHAFDGHFSDPNSPLPFMSGTLAQNLLPKPLDQSNLAGPLRGLTEMASNYDFFRQKSIVSPLENNLPLQQRRGLQNASRFGIAAGKLFNVDGRKIDHLVQANLGGLGKSATLVSDVGRDDRPVTTGRALNAAVGLFSESPSYDSMSVQRLMAKLQDAGKQPPKGFYNAVKLAKTPQERDAIKRELRDAVRDALDGGSGPPRGGVTARPMAAGKNVSLKPAGVLRRAMGR